MGSGHLSWLLLMLPLEQDKVAPPSKALAPWRRTSRICLSSVRLHLNAAGPVIGPGLNPPISGVRKRTGTLDGIVSPLALKGARRIAAGCRQTLRNLLGPSGPAGQCWTTWTRRLFDQGHQSRPVGSGDTRSQWNGGANGREDSRAGSGPRFHPLVDFVHHHGVALEMEGGLGGLRMRSRGRVEVCPAETRHPIGASMEDYEEVEQIAWDGVAGTRIGQWVMPRASF
ncbi:hypothetical protein N7462_004181 [Penicillium macrosclerotiorum]|uniref:uncharacterized protein n=1 Tax=Penicillium macrosclerotiorum TaxID=303699 RepID=UPI0025471EDB|nr:uncharacterized protein N7462_004181 [Penicillium macrosclerotiorum]KAJ5689789.1 hypothetical protein N7462_004181 [Penicillium macrosclerotiorum]